MYIQVFDLFLISLLFYGCLSLVAEQLGNLVFHQGEGLVVFAAVEDDVRVGFGGLHVGVMHRLDRGEILLDDAVQIAAAVADVPSGAAQDALVGVGLYVDLQIHTGP